MTNFKKFFLAGFLLGLILSITLTAGFNLAKAIWIEPTQSPPGGNLDPFTKTFKSTLVADPDASTFTGNMEIGKSSNVANFYVAGGEFSAKWIHSTETGENNIAGNLNTGGKIKVGKNVSGCTLNHSCTAGEAGSICFDNGAAKQVLGCNGTNWIGLGGN